MANGNVVNKICIEKLFGKYDYEIELVDNRLILVAPNGSGKTTILRIIYYYLSGQWEKLKSDKLESIKATINGVEIEKYNVNRSSGNKKISIVKKQEILSKYLEYKEALEKILSISIEELNNSPFLVQEIAAEYDAHEPLLKKIIDELIAEELQIKELPLTNIQILFLPTYRRIERGIDDVFPEFAEKLTTLLKDNIDILSINIAEEKVSNGEDYSQIEQDIINEINKFWDELNKPSKKKYTEGKVSYEELVSFGMNDVSILLREQCRKIKNGDAEANENLEKFLELCLEFMDNKSMKINELGELEMMNIETKDLIMFNDLSSGEKQITSLLAHIIFRETDTFLIIDEPELSLSIIWQEKLLKNLQKLSKLKGLIVATHSTHILKELMYFTHSLEEYIK